MVTIRTITAAFLILWFPLPLAAQDAGLFDELAAIYPDTNGASGAERLTIDTARGVPAGVHAVISGLPAGAEVACRLMASERPCAFRLIDVPVEQNTGLVSRTGDMNMAAG